MLQCLSHKALSRFSDSCGSISTMTLFLSSPELSSCSNFEFLNDKYRCTLSYVTNGYQKPKKVSTSTYTTWTSPKCHTVDATFCVHGCWSGIIPNGDRGLLTCGNDRGLYRILESEAVIEPKMVCRFPAAVKQIAYSTDEDLMAVTLANNNVDFFHADELFGNTANFEKIGSVDDHEGEAIGRIEFMNAQGKQTPLLASYGDTIRLYGTQFQESSATSDSPGVKRSLMGSVRDSRAFSTFTTNEHVLATGVGCSQAYVRFWDVAQQMPFLKANNFLGVLSLDLNVAQQECVVGTGDGSWGYQGNVYVVDLRDPDGCRVSLTGKIPNRLSGSYCVRACSDGVSVLSGHGNGQINIYDRRKAGLVSSRSLREKPRSKCVINHLTEWGDRIVATTASRQSSLVYLTQK